MELSIIQKINKIELSARDECGAPEILWMMAACGSNRDSLTFRDHSHTYFELHMVLEGEMTYGTGDKTLTVTEGGFVIIGPRAAHRVIGCSECFTKMTVAFNVPEGDALYLRLCRCFGKAFPISDAMKESVAFIANNTDSTESYLHNIIRMRLAETVYHAALSVKAQSEPEASDGLDKHVRRAMKYVESNPNIFFTCEEVADFCRISTKQLGRLFRRDTGCGLLQYIHSVKLDSAKSLLRESEMSETAIANELGFSCLQYFTKFFKRYTGKSPSEYRRSNV